MMTISKLVSDLCATNVPPVRCRRRCIALSFVWKDTKNRPAFLSSWHGIAYALYRLLGNGGFIKETTIILQALLLQLFVLFFVLSHLDYNTYNQRILNVCNYHLLEAIHYDRKNRFYSYNQ
jgi:hypothetical protein